MDAIWKPAQKKLLPFYLCLALVLSLLGGCGKQKSFDTFLNQLFMDEVSENTINLHFTVEDPKAYGITDYKVSLGDFSKESRKKTHKELKKTQKSLLKYPYLALSTEEKLTYEVLKDSLETNIKLAEYDLFAELLTPNNGLQIQLPILMSEYSFRTLQDVEDYLELLSMMDEYYDAVIEFEKEKANAGLFMSDNACKGVIESCESFAATKNDSFLIRSFDSRLQKLEGLSEEERKEYTDRNKAILQEQVYPAYDTLISSLTELLGLGTNDLGLCFYDNGMDYYELLVYARTGCKDSVPTIFSSIDAWRNQDLIACTLLQEDDAEILDKCNSLEWQMSDPKEMLTLLQQKMTKDFPEISDVSYEISNVDEALEEFLSPAFYITAPLDNYNCNRIYINPASMYADIYFFTTLAHEGYPGHLYQTIHSYDHGLAPIRCMLDYSGYTEGWATYVEFLSYAYADIDPSIASFLSHNQSAILSLYASSDIGLHYYGWTADDMVEFWSSYGITDTDTILEITDYILSEPGTYLSYYVGYIQFLELRDNAKTKYGADFSLKEFHRTLLRIGPAPFAIIEKYIPEYYQITE